MLLCCVVDVHKHKSKRNSPDTTMTLIAASDVVQFVRNGLSCVKDWQIGPSWLHDPEVTAQYYEFPEPLNKTTPLEVIVSPFQLYPFIFLTKAGFVMFLHSLKKVRRVQNLLDARTNQRRNSNPKTADQNDEQAMRLVEAKLIKDGNRATRDVFVGTQLCFTGICL